jgi:hypothetical protein
MLKGTLCLRNEFNTANMFYKNQIIIVKENAICLFLQVAMKMTLFVIEVVKCKQCSI